MPYSGKSPQQHSIVGPQEELNSVKFKETKPILLAPILKQQFSISADLRWFSNDRPSSINIRKTEKICAIVLPFLKLPLVYICNVNSRIRDRDK